MILYVGGHRSQDNKDFFAGRVKSCPLGDLFQLDEILLKPYVPLKSGTVPRSVLGTSRNKNIKNQEPTGYRCQTHRHPEVGISFYRAAQPKDSVPKETSFMVTKAYEKIP